MGGLGSGGQNKKPVRLHRLQGTYREARHGSRGERVCAGPPAQETPPRHLDAVAKRFWRKYAPACVELGTLDEASQPAFVRLCASWSKVRDYAARIEEDGPVVETGSGSLKSHPLIPYLQKEEAAFHKLAGDFGMTPTGRKRLGLEGEVDRDEKPNPFAKFGDPRDRATLSPELAAKYPNVKRTGAEA